MRPIVTALVLSVLASLAPLDARAAEPIVIRFSHVVAPNTPKGKAADRFRDLAERYTEGRVRVEVYPNSTLYKDREELEALQLGAAQMLAPSLAKFGPLGIREFEVFDLPFIFPSKAALRKVTEGPVGRSLLKKLEDKGISGLAYWDNGFKIMSANVPLRRPEDFAGLRMRIQPSRVIEAQMKALGAVPRVTAFSEVYQALRSGAVDGTENPPSNMFTQGMHEVQKYATLSDHGYLGYVVIVNKKFWDALPSDIRAKLERAMAEATAYANEIAERENMDAIAAMKAAGTTEFITLGPEERRAWIEALKPVHAEMAGRLGKDLVEAIHRETGITN